MSPKCSVYMSALIAVCTRGEDFKRQCRAEGMLELCMEQAALAVPECALQGTPATSASPQLACSTLGDLSNRSVHQVVSLVKAIVSGDDSTATVSKAFDHAREVVGSKVAAVYTLASSCISSAMADPAGTGVPPIVKECVSLLRCLAVNDSICVQFTDDGALQLLTSVAEKYPKHAPTIRNVCGAIKKLAHSDHVKRAVCAGDAKPLSVLLSGLQGFMTDASVVEQALAALSVSVLRTPENAQMVADKDALPFIAKAMQMHPDAAGLQRQACLCVRNLVSRSKSSLTEPLLEEGVEALLRAAKASHPACQDVAKAALRDLGF